ncbi:DUF2842 domain-containing protein [Roseomonas sp. BN140053]|uniref:DUF2842 domain-containing protein n=1 Tax=Roseomonas sp. BN140053 TaxID=3391898 RepID=UPI0039EBCFB1
MNRLAIAILLGLSGLLLYVVAVVALADFVIGLHWTVQALYYLVTGLVWAIPISWLMRWAARGRAPAGDAREG